MKSRFFKLHLFHSLLVNSTGEFYVIEHFPDEEDIPVHWAVDPYEEVTTWQPGSDEGRILGPKGAAERTFHVRPAPHDRYIEVRQVADGHLLNYWFDEVKPDMEMPDPTPVEIPAHLLTPPSLQDEMRRIVQALRLEVAPEADPIDDEDYEVEPNELPLSPYELAALPLVPDLGPHDPSPTPAPSGGATPAAPEAAPPAGGAQPQPVSAPSAP